MKGGYLIHAFRVAEEAKVVTVLNVMFSYRIQSSDMSHVNSVAWMLWFHVIEQVSLANPWVSQLCIIVMNWEILSHGFFYVKHALGYGIRSFEKFNSCIWWRIQIWIWNCIVSISVLNNYNVSIL